MTCPAGSDPHVLCREPESQSQCPSHEGRTIQSRNDASILLTLFSEPHICPAPLHSTTDGIIGGFSGELEKSPILQRNWDTYRERHMPAVPRQSTRSKSGDQHSGRLAPKHFPNSAPWNKAGQPCVSAWPLESSSWQMHFQELHSTDEDPLYCRRIFPARSGNREMDKEIGRKEGFGGQGGNE